MQFEGKKVIHSCRINPNLACYACILIRGLAGLGLGDAELLKNLQEEETDLSIQVFSPVSHTCIDQPGLVCPACIYAKGVKLGVVLPIIRTDRLLPAMTEKLDLRRSALERNKKLL